jgi:hypothetical protein
MLLMGGGGDGGAAAASLPMTGLVVDLAAVRNYNNSFHRGQLNGYSGCP